MKNNTKSRLRHAYENLFVGHHSLILVIGFTTGGMLMGRSLWHYLFYWFGNDITFIVGFVIFLITGLYMNQFYDVRESTKKHRD